MSADHSTPASPSNEPLTFGSSQLIGVLALAALTAIAAMFFDGAVPVVIAAAVAAIVPKQHGWNVRAPIAVMAGLLALFIVHNWPGAATATAEAPGAESGHLLTWIIGLPLVGSFVVLFMPRQSHEALRTTTLTLMLATLVLTLPLLQVQMGRTYHFNEDYVWMSNFGIHYHVAIDGLALWLVLLTVFITPIAAYASFGSVSTRIKDWCFALLLLEAGMLGAFVSLDLFLFYVFWELMLIPMYVMIGVWGGSGRIYSAIKFFLYTFFGSLLMLAAILYLAYTYARLNGGHPSFDYFELQRLMLPRNVQIWLWAAFTLAFVIKVPMFPVHTWLPDAHTEAPTAGSIILAAVMLKMGTYGYLRFSLGLFPEACAEFGANLAGVAVLGGIVYGALCAWKQSDVKRLIAYSSVAHLGYVMLGLFALTDASIEGSVLQMVNHGVSTGMLFLLFGMVYDRRHTRQLDQFGGLAKPMPVYATLFVIATLASVGLPGTNGFIGEFMVITGTFASHTLGNFNGVQAVGAAVGVILGAIYMLMVVQKMFFGPITRKENANLSDVTPRELIAAAPLAMMIFVIGFFPNIFLSKMKDAAARVRDDFEARVSMNPAPKFYDGPIRLTAPRPERPGAAPAAVAKAAAAPEAPSQAPPQVPPQVH
jgi:NADH-quinone oxidoreductase subunit M